MFKNQGDVLQQYICRLGVNFNGHDYGVQHPKNKNNKKILNEILNSFEANKYVNTLIRNKKKYVKCIKISCKSCQCLLTSTSEPWFLKRDNNLKPWSRFGCNHYLRHTREGCCIFYFFLYFFIFTAVFILWFNKRIWFSCCWNTNLVLLVPLVFLSDVNNSVRFLYITPTTIEPWWN